MKNIEIKVIGAGLAGCEAALTLADKGYKVKLYEIKPKKFTEVHKSDNFAELVCSNSFGSMPVNTSSGLFKEELRILGSKIIEIANEFKVPAGQALAVDREKFSLAVTKKIKENKNIQVIEEEYKEIIEDELTIIASGPLTTNELSENINNFIGEEHLYFYDAVAPLVTKDSINFDKTYFASRYDKGEGEYINCPFTKEEYDKFYTELINAETIELKKFEKEKFYEACMPIEKLAKRGEKTLLFGPLKPKGLTNPRTDSEDYAVCQLRQDDLEQRVYNLVGFQTNLKWNDQKRILSMIPGLENADFVRLGVMHRNTFINSSKLLNGSLNLKSNKNIFFAGQITGSEGYTAAIATGLLSAINVMRLINNQNEFVLEDLSLVGALIKYITTEKKKFQPTGPNFGIIRPLEKRVRNKKERYSEYSNRSLAYINNLEL